MPFLRGSLGFERFTVEGFELDSFTKDHIDLLTHYAAGRTESQSLENVHVGFLGGDHLFDTQFDLSKNFINGAAHFAVRIDTNVIPAAIKAAWLQMELAGIARDNEGAPVTSAQKKEAKEAVEQRCEVEAASGKYRKMKTFPVLWDIGQEQMYFGGPVGNASGLCIDLIERAFKVEFRRLGAGALAKWWASQSDRYDEIEDAKPTNFVDGGWQRSPSWANEHSGLADFLGNEFLLWLWWTSQTQGDTITLDDDSAVTVMLAKTLALECPAGDFGKETITATSPTELPETIRAVQSGKMLRKSGLSLFVEDRRFDLVIQAETFAVSGAKIHLDDDEEFGDEQRIDAIRLLSDTVDALFYRFCDDRTSKTWKKTQAKITTWLQKSSGDQQRAA